LAHDFSIVCRFSFTTRQARLPEKSLNRGKVFHVKHSILRLPVVSGISAFAPVSRETVRGAAVQEAQQAAKKMVRRGVHGAA